MKNRYVNRSRIPEKKFRELMKYFCLDLEAVKISKLKGLSEQTLTKYFRVIREKIAKICENEATVCGEIEADESYFGPRRQKGKRGSGASRKTIIFGLYKRNGKMYTEIVPDTKKSTLQAVIRGRVDIESFILMVGVDIMDSLIWGIKNTFECITEKVNFLVAKHILMVLKTFGA